MKFTLRRSGRRMATVQVAHHIGGAEIFKILCRFTDLPYSDRDREDELPWPRFSLTKVENLVRLSVHGYGVDAYLSEGDWSENYEDREIGRIARWVDGEVRRLYPELIDDEYSEYAEDLLRFRGEDVEND